MHAARLWVNSCTKPETPEKGVMRGRRKAVPSGWRVVCTSLCAAAIALQTLLASLLLIAPRAAANALGDVIICSHDGARVLAAPDGDEPGTQGPSDARDHCFVCACHQMSKALAAPAAAIVARPVVTSWRLGLVQQQNAPRLDPPSPYASRAPPPHV